MKKKFRVVLTAAAALLVLAIAVVAAGEYSGPAGSENDPLVTMSYIDDIFTVEMQKYFKQELQTQTDSLRDSLESRIEALEEACEAAAGTEAGLYYRELKLESGNELICKAGTELLLRAGSAYVMSGGSGLADTSGGETPGRGSYIAKNHMYLVTEDGCGICADGSITVLVRGDCEVE